MYKNIIVIFLWVAGSGFLFAGTEVYPVAIIGSGAGGTMAAKRAALNNLETVLFTGAKKERKRSRGYWVRKVDNIPGLAGYKRTIVDLEKETLAEIANNLTVVNNSVASIEKRNGLFTLHDKSGKTYQARYVILATGMMDEQPHIKGSIKPVLSYANRQNIAYCLLCDGHKSHMKNTAVIGYSEEAAKSALVLAHRYQPAKLTLLTNGIPHTITAETVALLKAKQINIVEEPIHSLIGDKKELSGFVCKSGKTVEADIGFVSLGIRPNNELALELGAKVDAKGLVETDANGESSVSNLFIVGDLRAGSMKQIYTAWQHAVEVVQLVDRRIRN